MTRAEVIMRSAELRMDNALAALRRQVFGDDAHHAEVLEVAKLDLRATFEAPPDPAVRGRLRRLWAWNKRIRGR